MKIVFFGSSEFAVPSLKRLLEHRHEVLAVVTRPDRKKGRRLVLSETPVKKASLKKGVNVLQPENPAEAGFLKKLRSLKADLFVVVSFGRILTREILSAPKVYCINLHPSLLPKYRGAAPVNWAVIKDEKKTGLTIIKMNEKMDAGDIMLQRKVAIEKEDTSETLNKRLSELGAILLLDAVRFIEEDRISFKKQNEKLATFAPRLKKEDGIIDWAKPAAEIHNRVRGTLPWPGAYTHFEGEKINIWKTDVDEGTASPGEVVEAEKELVIGTKKFLIKVEEIQLEGKKRMTSAEFLRGYKKLKKGDSFCVKR